MYDLTRTLHRGSFLPLHLAGEPSALAGTGLDRRGLVERRLARSSHTPARRQTGPRECKEKPIEATERRRPRPTFRNESPREDVLIGGMETGEIG